MNPLRGIKENRNSYATTIINALRAIKENKNFLASVINASNKSEQALRAIKTLSFLIKEFVLYVCHSIINLPLSRMNHNYLQYIL